MSVTTETTQLSPAERVERAYRRITELDRPEVWIHLRSREDVLADAREVQRRSEAGQPLPLAGLLLAVKDNVDVAGIATTAGCPEFAYLPERNATAVDRLVEAGAIVLGKTNLDQFATGLVGTRSPYGPVRNALRPDLISGGSSSGSAVAVALGIADIGIGTDTAGSGRVPAALNGIVGVKSTIGIVPTSGVVPACADYDCVTVFAAELELAVRATRIMAGPDETDPRGREWPADVRMAARTSPRVAIPRDSDLEVLSPEYRTAFAATVQTARDRGFDIGVVDMSPLLDAARLLYDGAIVAERFTAVGSFVENGAAGLDPTVARIVGAAREPRGHEFAADLDALVHAKATAATLLSPFDGILLPTTTEHPSIESVLDEPLSINRRMGTFTNFCNLLDMCAVAVPGTRTESSAPFGVMVVAPAFHDQVAVDLAAALSAAPAPSLVDGGAELAVFGAHLRGQPLHFQLEDIGARFVDTVTTTDAYRLSALDTTPPKPGLVEVGDGKGAPIIGELFRVSPAGLGSFLAALPAPMALTSVKLSDGRSVVGFSCTYSAVGNSADITEHGGWVKYLRARELSSAATVPG